MKKEKTAAYDSKPVPHKIPATHVVEFMTQNIFELRAILLKAKLRQKDDWANPAKRRRRRDAGQNKQPSTAHTEAPRDRLECRLNLSRWPGGKAQNPLQLSLLLVMSEENVNQYQQVCDPDPAKGEADGKGPGAWNLQCAGD
jgi:hypothetical protein